MKRESENVSGSKYKIRKRSDQNITADPKAQRKTRESADDDSMRGWKGND